MVIESDGSEGFNRQSQRCEGGRSLHMCRIKMVRSPGSKGYGKNWAFPRGDRIEGFLTDGCLKTILTPDEEWR